MTQVRTQAVFCGEHFGTFVFPEDANVRVNNTNAKIVLPEGEVISPSAFETLAGKGSQKKWKNSIKFSLPDGRVFSIGSLLDPEHLPPAKKEEEEKAPIFEENVDVPIVPIRQTAEFENRCSAVVVSKPLANITVFPFVQLTADGSLRQGSQRMAVGDSNFLDGHTVVRTLYGNDWQSFTTLFLGTEGAFLKCFLGVDGTCAMVHVDNLETKVDLCFLGVKVAMDNPLFPTHSFQEMQADGHVLDLHKKWSEYMSADIHYSVHNPFVVHIG